jgi:hypothetical protein
MGKKRFPRAVPLMRRSAATPIATMVATAKPSPLAFHDLFPRMVKILSPDNRDDNALYSWKQK